MVKLWGKYTDSDDQVLVHSEFWQQVQLEVGKTYVYTFNYYTSPETTALGRIYMYNDCSITGILAQKVLAHREEGTIRLEYTATEGKDKVMVGIAPGSIGYSYVWNMRVTEAGSNVNMLQNADFSDGNGSLNKWSVRGVGINSNTVKEKFGQTVMPFDRSLWATLVTTAMATLEAKNPNSNFSFETNPAYYESDHLIDANQHNNTSVGTGDGDENVATGVEFGIGNVIAAGMLFVALILLRLMLISSVGVKGKEKQ